MQALEFLTTFAQQFKLQSVERLDVAGAFHTPLMAGVYHACSNALKRIGDIGEPQIVAMSNVSGTIHTTVGEVKRLLATQASRPVLWEQIMHRLYMRPPDIEHPSTIGVGPGDALGTRLAKVNALAFRKYRRVDL